MFDVNKAREDYALASLAYSETSIKSGLGASRGAGVTFRRLGSPRLLHSGTELEYLGREIIFKLGTFEQY